jgi:hypothetical protein
LTSTLAGNPRLDYVCVLELLSGAELTEGAIRLDALTLAGIYRAKARRVAEVTAADVYVARAAVRAYEAAAEALSSAQEMVNADRPELALTFAQAARAQVIAAEEARIASEPG